MKVSDLIQKENTCGFSFEVPPPLKGKGITQIYNTIDRLREFNPLYINITTHRSEFVFKSNDDGTYQRVSERSRPGTVAVAAAIQQKYGIPAVPHIICSGFSKIETEYALIDLNFLGIETSYYYVVTKQNMKIALCQMKMDILTPVNCKTK